MFTVNDISAFYGRTPIIGGASFTLAPGERVAVVGRNGAGKSTLIKALLGFTETRGEIEFDGQRVEGLPNQRMRRFGFGYLPQERRVSASLSVDDNLRTSAYNRGKAVRLDLNAWIRRRGGGEAARQVGSPVDSLVYMEEFLRPLLGKRAGSLSGGEQAIVGLSCGILSCASVLFLDEPSAGASEQFLAAIHEILVYLPAGRHRGILFVEQNHLFVHRLATRLLWVRQRGEQMSSSVVSVALPLRATDDGKPRELLDELELGEQLS